MAELLLTSPPGYGKITMLQRDAHAGMGVKPSSDHRWAAGLNAVYLTAEEFAPALLHYPIAFTRDANSGRAIPIAVLGLGDRGNFFVESNGDWRDDTYVPGYVRRFPFCLSQRKGEDTSALVVCVQEDRLDRSQPALLDAEGKPSEAFKAQHDLIRAMEEAQRVTTIFTAELERLQLLVTLNDLIVPRTSTQLNLKGLLRVDEEKLHALSPDTLHGLAVPGYLRAIHAHLFSLANFARLANIAARRAAH